MKNKIPLLALLIGLTLACNLPIQGIENRPPAEETAIYELALTVTSQAEFLAALNNPEASSTTPPSESTPTSLPTATNIPEAAPPTTTSVPSASPAPATTATPMIPIVSVSANTNCRTGPGQIYDVVGALLIGESAEITGKNSNSNYWIIRNPDNPTTTCWLWGEHASISGNQSSLSEISIPPSPTPTKLSPPNAVSNLNGSGSCDDPGGSGYHLHTVSGTITWKDNSNNEQGFTIYADHLLGDAPQQIGSVDANNTSYNFSVITLDNPFALLVTSNNAAGSSKRVSVNISYNCHP